MEGRSDHVADGIKVDIWSQILPSQGRETPLELLLTGGSLSDCAEHNECKADMRC